MIPDQSTESVTFGLTAQTKELDVDPDFMEFVTLRFGALNCTDAGIAAGETGLGWLHRFRLGEPGNWVLHTEYDEHAEISKALAGDEFEGCVEDTIPTTATDEERWITFYGPFDLRNHKSPRAEITVRAASAEWAGVAAMDTKCWVEWKVMAPTQKPVIVHRDYYSSESKKTFGLGEKGKTFALRAELGSADVWTGGGLMRGKKEVYTFTADKVKMFGRNWFRHTNETPTDTFTKYWLDGMNMPVSDGSIVISLSSAQSMLVYTFNHP